MEDKEELKMGNDLSISALGIGVLALIIGLAGMIYPESDSITSTESGSLVSWVLPNRWHRPFQYMPRTFNGWGDLGQAYSDYLLAIPFPIPRAMNISKLGIHIRYYNSLDEEQPRCRIGWYNDTGQFYPDELLEESEYIFPNTSVPTETDIELNFSVTEHNPNVYWAVFIKPYELGEYDENNIEFIYWYYGNTRWHGALWGFVNIPNINEGIWEQVYLKSYSYGSLPSIFPSSATVFTTNTFHAGFVIYIMELL